MTWHADYVGAPFADGGRGPDAFDCWGLVRAVYREILWIDLPNHSEIATSDHRGVARAMDAGRQAGPWGPVDVPRAFDVMVARRDPHSRYPGHVGIMIGAQSVLHVWKGRDVHVSRLREPGLGGLVLGFYRHEDMLC